MTDLQTLQRRVYTAPHGKKRQREQELREAIHAALVREFDANVNRAARLAVEGRV